jgi:hypothetical protein
VRPPGGGGQASTAAQARHPRHADRGLQSASGIADLADHSRSDYQRIFDYLQPIAGTALARFDAPLVARIRDKAAEGGKRRINSGLTLYGLRHMILRECGYNERTIADALGQKTIEMARLYARGADLTKKMSGVAKTLGRELNRRRTKVSNLSRNVSNRKASADGRSSKHQSNSCRTWWAHKDSNLGPALRD